MSKSTQNKVKITKETAIKTYFLLSFKGGFLSSSPKQKPTNVKGTAYIIVSIINETLLPTFSYKLGSRSPKRRIECIPTRAKPMTEGIEVTSKVLQMRSLSTIAA